MLLSIVRALAALVLGLAVFAGFLVWAVLNQAAGKVFDAGVYGDALAGVNAYERIYSEVLAGEEGELWMGELLGENLPVDYGDLTGIVREAAPPEYLQGQVEGNLNRAAAYFQGETERLELYLELAEPLARLGAAALDYVEGRIDRLEVVEPGMLFNPLAGQEYVRALGESLEGLIFREEVPETIPSIAILPDLVRPAVFELVVAQLPEYLELPAAARDSWMAAEPELRGRFGDGDTPGFLKAAARAIGEPVVEQGIAEAGVAMGLDERGRWHLLPLAAEGMGYAGAAELQQEIDGARDRVNGLLRSGQGLALATVGVGALLMGLVYLPNLARSLRWPGVTLLLSGAGGVWVGLAGYGGAAGTGGGWCNAVAGVVGGRGGGVGRVAGGCGAGVGGGTAGRFGELGVGIGGGRGGFAGGGLRDGAAGERAGRIWGLVKAAVEEVGVAAEEVGDGGGTAAFELDLLQGKDTLGGGYGGRGFGGVQGDYLAGGGVRVVGMVKSGYG